jgi:oxygen-independent coproporphyrinogen III oxidase
MRERGMAAHATIEAVSGSSENALGIYISIPFCRSKCTYCNFASGVYPASEHERYVDRVIEDLHHAESWAAQAGVELPRRVDTVYLGGGTPNLLAPELLKRLFAALRADFALDANAEITMECAPGQFAAGTLGAMAAAGVQRVSLGVQSFVDGEARASGRLHTRAAVERDLCDLRAAGIANVNVDLIAGLAGQTAGSWDESLSALIDSGAPHASVYMLEVDEDSRLGRELLAGGARYHAQAVPTDDAIAHMYEHAIERLAAAGIEQYEISNFARPGCASRHNLRYWQRRPYLGVGLDASSMLRAREPAERSTDDSQPCGADLPEMRPVLRSKTTDDLADYLAGGAPVETAWLSAARQHEEAWFLGLRLHAGVDLAALEGEFGRACVEPARAVAEQLAQDGLLAFEENVVRLTPRGRLLSNDVFQEFLGLEREMAPVVS